MRSFNYRPLRGGFFRPEITLPLKFTSTWNLHAMKALLLCVLISCLATECRCEDAVRADTLRAMQSQVVAFKGKWIADLDATVQLRSDGNQAIEPVMRKQVQETFEATEIVFEENAGVWTATCTRVSGKIEQGWTLLYDANFTPYIAIIGRAKVGLLSIKLDGERLTLAPATRPIGMEIVFIRSK
jgi:hypothetical protein